MNETIVKLVLQIAFEIQRLVKNENVINERCQCGRNTSMNC